MPSPEADRLVHTSEEQAELSNELARLAGIETIEDRVRRLLAEMEESACGLAVKGATEEFR